MGEYDDVDANRFCKMEAGTWFDVEASIPETQDVGRMAMGYSTSLLQFLKNPSVSSLVGVSSCVWAYRRAKPQLNRKAAA